MRTSLPVALLVALAACGGDDTPATDTTDTADTSEVVDCGGCPDGKLCCPSRFDGDIPRCVDATRNPENCGRCGKLCTGSEQMACEDSQCVASPNCTAGSTCPGDLVCDLPSGASDGRCCPPGTKLVMSPADFFGCCPDGDICGCREGNCPISLRAVKSDIRYLAPDELARLGEQLLSTRLATWRYTAGGPHRHLGFIIDDGPPTEALTADRGRVDLYGYISATVAALQTQAKDLAAMRARLDALERRLDALATPR